MNRRIILVVCIVCAVGALAVLGLWSANSDPGAKELDYLDKADAAAHRAQAALDLAQSSPSGGTVADVQVADYQPALDEEKQYRTLAEAEMGYRVSHNKNLICLAAALGLVSLATGMVLLLPSRRD